MIDWFGVAANTFWILGLALGLATFSYASWQASIYHEKTRERIKRPQILLSFNVAALLFCTGLAATSDSTLEIVLWSLLGILFLVQLLLAVRQIRKSTTEFTKDQKNTNST